MLNLAVAYVPALLRDKRDAEEGFLGKGLMIIIAVLVIIGIVYMMKRK
jgi:hypothetical protein